MDLQTISLIISVGAVLGTGFATFFAQKKSTSEKVNREIIADQEVRITQLEDERKRDKQTIDDQAQQIKRLQEEKRLPLTQLTKLVTSQNKATTEILNTIVQLLKEQKK